jgi:gas vesicle protein GvpK
MKRRQKRPPRKAARHATRRRTRAVDVAALEVRELESMRAELERLARKTAPPRWNADPDDVRKAVAKLVLTLVEFIRQLLERQAIRRMDAGTLTSDQTEAVGLALMRLEDTVRELAAQFDLTPEDLNLDLGGAGRLM